MIISKYIFPILVFTFVISMTCTARSYQDLVLNRKDYAGFYQIGPNGETGTLRLMVTEEEIFAQIRYYVRSGKNHYVYINLAKPTLIKNQLVAVNFQAKFILHNDYAKPHRALLVEECTLKGFSFSNIAGDKFDLPISTFVRGKYPQASLETLKGAELKKHTKSQLRVMRNEIFARYGYRFRPGGVMDTYFRNQEWYSPGQVDINSVLTGLERNNIGLIKKFEKLAKVATNDEEIKHSAIRQQFIKELSRFKKALIVNDKKTLVGFFEIRSGKVSIFDTEISTKKQFFEKFERVSKNLKKVFQKLDLSEFKHRNWIRYSTQGVGLNYIRLNISEQKKQISIAYNLAFRIDGTEDTLETSFFWEFYLDSQNRMKFLKTLRAG